VFVAEGYPPRLEDLSHGAQGGDQRTRRRNGQGGRAFRRGGRPQHAGEPFYKLVVDPQTGAIESLQDKKLSREMVDRDAAHQLNQLVARRVESGRLETPQKVTIEKGLTGPVCASLVVTTAGVGCPQVTQEVILYDQSSGSTWQIGS